MCVCVCRPARSFSVQVADRDQAPPPPPQQDGPVGLAQGFLDGYGYGNIFGANYFLGGLLGTHTHTQTRIGYPHSHPHHDHGAYECDVCMGVG